MRQSHTASFSGFSTATTRRSMTRTVLALTQRLVDELDRLSQCCVLSGLRRADDLLGHPGGEESGEADDVRFVGAHRFDELLRWAVHPEVDDFEAGALEHDDHQVLAD